jgi:hypothetical protein
MRFPVHFVSFYSALVRSHFVRRQSSLQSLRLQPARLLQGLIITAQGGSLTRIMPAITRGATTIGGTTPIVTIVATGTSRAPRVGSAAWRKCTAAALPTAMSA